MFNLLKRVNPFYRPFIVFKPLHCQKLCPHLHVFDYPYLLTPNFGLPKDSKQLCLKWTLHLGAPITNKISFQKIRPDMTII